VKTLHQMHLHMPSVVLVPDTFLAGSDMSSKNSASTSVLVQYIQEEFPGVPIEPVARKYWNEGGGEYGCQ
jgi:DNA mismatch repair protein MSH4